MIRLEKFSPIDFPQFLAWVDSLETLVQFAGATTFNFPVTIEQLQSYCDKADRQIFKVMHEKENKNIGHAELLFFEERKVRICRVLIGDNNFRGKGIGQAIIAALVDKVFIELNLPYLELNVYDWNTSAIRCYEKVGFKLNPHDVNYSEFDGKKWKALNMTINKSDWKSPNEP
jgi:RimJ/RimL family protein N-acetyltransferase